MFHKLNSMHEIFKHDSSGFIVAGEVYCPILTNKTKETIHNTDDNAELVFNIIIKI